MIEQQLAACYESRTCLGGLLILGVIALAGIFIMLRHVGRK